MYIYINKKIAVYVYIAIYIYIHICIYKEYGGVESYDFCLEINGELESPRSKAAPLLRV